MKTQPYFISPQPHAQYEAFRRGKKCYFIASSYPKRENKLEIEL